MTHRLLISPLVALALLSPLRAQEAEPLRTPPSRPVDVLDIDLDLLVDLPAKSVAGRARLRLRALEDVQVVRLDAADHQVDAVGRVRPELQQADPVEACPYSYDGEALTVELPLRRGDEATLVVDYRVVEPEDGLNFFGPTEAEPDVPLQVWSQGESTSNRHWFPCLDHPDERQTTSITAHVREGLTVISNGVLVGKAPSPRGEGLVAWRYEQRRPHVAYLVSLVVGTFDAATDAWRGQLPLGYYVPRGRGADIPRSFARTPEMLELFSKLTGVDYPWPKYDQVVVEQFSAGGMENTGATTLNERTLHDERAHLDYSSEGLVAHELAHQWYGDLLTCRDWAHLWLNESFATFFAAVWTERSEGQEAYDYELLGQSENGMHAGRERAIVDRRYPDPGSMFDGRAYPKGSSVLHMLRRQLGEEAFWRGIQAYTAAHQDRGVETDDLRRSLEQATGRNLERFFSDWLLRPGHPRLDVRLDRDAARGLLTVSIRQTQPGEPYAFPAELELWFGEERVTRTFDVTSKEERFVLPERRAPTRFRFDPREAVILKEVTVHKGRDLWLAQLQHDSVVGRIRAARELVKQWRPEVRRALLAALAEDPFWGVRAEVAELLGKASGDEARDALVARLAAESHPKVRRACAEALGARGRDPVAAAALRARIEQGDASYYAQAAAVEGYARAVALAAPEARELLTAQLQQDSHNEVIRLAAIRGLGHLQDLEATTPLAALAGPPHHEYVRREAARTLGTLAALPGASQRQVDEAVASLRGLLRRVGRRDRQAALDGLRALGVKAAAALPDVDAVGVQDPSQRVRDRAAEVGAAIRAAQPPEAQLARLRERTQTLEAQVKELQTERAALEARLKRLEEAAQQAAAAAAEKAPAEQEPEQPPKAKGSTKRRGR